MNKTVAAGAVFTEMNRKSNSEARRVMRQLRKNKAAIVGLVIFLVEIVLAIFATSITPYGYNTMDMTHQFALPSLEHPFGCDDVGRDILSRVLYGGRYSLSMGIIATLASNGLGMVIGAIAGYAGGWVDNLIMRILDVIQALPGMLLMIVLSAMLGPGFGNTILAMTIAFIPYPARLLRAQMLKERENEYIEASRSINCSSSRIIFSHLIPNCLSPIIVNTTMGIASRITFAATLSFIGLGVQPPIPEWGAMLASSRQFMRSYPHLVIFPGLAIAITVLSLNLLGDGLRDALDPKLKN
jgi:peptide/nickel transport system permease protein